MPASDNKLLEALSKKGLLKPSDWEWLKTELMTSAEPVETLLLKHNLATETDIAKTKAEISATVSLLRVPCCELEPRTRNS